MSRKVVDYKTIVVKEIIDLNSEVKDFVNRGYELHGGPFQYWHFGVCKDYVAQAMVRYELFPPIVSTDVESLEENNKNTELFKDNMNNKVLDYICVTGTNAHNLASDVKKMLDKGYQPYGLPVQKLPDNNQLGINIQMMVKYKE